VRRADAELTVTGLPRELRIPRINGFDPTGGGRFDLLNKLCRRVVFLLCEENVDVVTHRIDFDKRRIKVIENPGDISVKLAAFTIAEERATVFGAEHQVNDYVGERLGHTVLPLLG
jgi:hypothetical protein